MAVGMFGAVRILIDLPGTLRDFVDLYGAHPAFIGLGGKSGSAKQENNGKLGTHGNLRSDDCTMNKN